jgi:ParB family chromosome partitioning protein
MNRFPYCTALDIDEGLALLTRRQAALSQAQLSDTLAFLHENGIRIRQLGQILGCPGYQVSHRVRIGRQLHAEVKELLHRGHLTIGHCRAIAGLPMSEQASTARNAIARKLSVRELEKVRSNIDTHLSAGDLQYYERLSERIGEAIGHPVSIRPSTTDKRAGTLTIQYTDSEMFDAICHRLRINLQDLI